MPRDADARAATAPAGLAQQMKRHAPALAKALAIGAAGGALFDRLHAPLPWMLGAVAATTAASLLRVQVAVPRGVRNIMVMVLGVMLGSAFTPALVGHLALWPVSLASVPLVAAVLGAMAVVLLWHVARYTPATTFFAGMPGGLPEMVLVGTAMGGDPRVISLTHALRILVIVSVVPLWFRLTLGIAPATGLVSNAGVGDIAGADLTILAGCVGVGWIATHYGRMSAAPLLGATAASAVVHVSGLTASRPPWELLVLAQIIIGAAIGARFYGDSLGFIGRTLSAAVVPTVAMILTAAGLAWGMAAVTDLPFAALLLAYMPGGLAELSLIALALDIDAAFVATHSIVRILLVVLVAPVVYRMLWRS